MSGNGKPITIGVSIVVLVVAVIVALGRVGVSNVTAPAALIHKQGPYSISLTVRPDKAGPNTFTVAIRRHGHPVTPASVRVLVTMLDMPMAQQVVVLGKQAPGKFSGSEELGMGGHWQFELLMDHLPGKRSLTTATFRVTVA